METLRWTKDQAKEYMLRYHMINVTKPYQKAADIKKIFDRIQMIQYDPLDNVGRNPDLVLQARIKNYKKQFLYDALYKERYLIDGWDKQMSIFKTEDFPYFSRIREDREKSFIVSLKKHGIEEVVDFEDEVLKQLKEKGPLFSRQITVNKYWKYGKLSSVTLDYLFQKGKIIVYDKINAQKKYQITEDVITNQDIYLPDEAFIMWYMKRRIKTLGFFWNKSAAWPGLFISKTTIRKQYIEKLVEEGFIQQVIVDDILEPFYVIKAYINTLNKVKKTISFIAPLDNMIWDRELIKAIFNFDYKWEVYVPKTKRRYGYYVLPILYGKNFIGRIEFENHHKHNPLVVKNIWFEENINITNNIKTALETALHNFASYLEADKVISIEIN